MGVLKHGANNMVFDDTTSQMGVTNVETAVVELDKRLDVIEVITTKGNAVENWEICRGNIFSLTTSTSNASSPGWATLGNSINGLIFADSRNQNVSTSFDLGNKYKSGTPIFLDLCYVPMSTSNGRILFKVEYNKGIPNTNSNELIANNTIITYEALNNNIVGNYKRISIELNPVGLDVNGMLIANIGRLGTNSSDTYVGTFALLAASLRYKTDNIYSIRG